MQRFNKSTIIISIVIVLLITGLGIVNFSGLDIPYLSWVEKGVYNLISPVIEYATVFYNSVKVRWVNILNVDDLILENENLRERIAKLEIDNNLMAYKMYENKRLRELLAFKRLIPYETLGAKVIGYSTSPWEHILMIDRGSKDGINLKMPVISYNGSLVGRIDYVGLGSSRVILLNDPEFVVGGIVQREDSRAIGLVKGQIDNNKHNTMDNISWNTESKEGDIVQGDIIVTSGLSNSFPGGLPIGKVSSVKKDNYGLSQIAEIGLFMNLKTIEEVLIITDF